MSSVPVGNAGLASAINNSISRVGQPLLAAVIFVVVSGSFYASLAAAVPGVDPNDPQLRAQVQPLNPPAEGTPPEVAQAATEASVDALHLAVDRVRGAARGRGAGQRDRAAVARRRGGRTAAAPGTRAAGVDGAGGRWLSAPGDPRTPHDWDGATYDRVADPMTRWGSNVLDRLPLRGDETVLDAGCGSGRVTEQLPSGCRTGASIALDASPSMVEAARERLARFGDRVAYVVADLGRAAAAAGRLGRRDPLDRDVPLGPRPRRAVREPRRACCGRAAGSSPSAAGPGTSAAVLAVLPDDRRRVGGPVDVRDARGDARAARGRRLHRHRDVAQRRAERVRARRAVPGVPADGRPRRAPRAAGQRRRARARSSMRSPSASRTPRSTTSGSTSSRRAPDRVRGPPSARDAERAAVARDHDVGDREDPRAVASIAAWSAANGSTSGVRSSRHHRWVIA